MRLASLILFCAACILPWSTQAAEQCGVLGDGFGPFDYRTDKDRLPIVEDSHFTPEVANLIRGKTGQLGGDIDYTLRAFPNHHRALMSMERLGAKLKTEKPPQARYTISCYFQRAVRFRPEDGTVRTLYAIYLSRQGKAAEALQQLQVAESSSGESANLHYNIGLIYLDLKDHDKALEHAHRAYQLGFPLPGLRNRLERAGKWRDPQKTQKPTIESPASTAGTPDKATDAAALKDSK